MNQTKQMLFGKQSLIKRRKRLEEELKECKRAINEIDKKVEKVGNIDQSIIDELSKEFKALDKVKKIKLQAECIVEMWWEEGLDPNYEVYKQDIKSTKEYKEYKKEVTTFWNKLKRAAKKHNITDTDLFYIIGG